MTDHLEAYIYGIGLTFGDQTKHIQVKKFTSKPNNNIIERMQGTIRARTKIMRDLKSLETAQTILNGFIIYYNYLRPHETLSSPHNDVTPARKAHIDFPYKNWEQLIRHTSEVKQTLSGVSFFSPPPLPRVKLSPQQRKLAEQRLYKRRKLETKRTGIPYQPKNKGGGAGRPNTLSSISSIPFTRNKRSK